MVKGKIERLGFDYNIEDEALDDYELIEVLNEIDKGNTPLITDAFKLLLGAEQLKNLKDIIRKKHGRVSTKEMMAVFSEIMQSCNETKK